MESLLVEVAFDGFLFSKKSFELFLSIDCARIISFVTSKFFKSIGFSFTLLD